MKNNHLLDGVNFPLPVVSYLKLSLIDVIFDLKTGLQAVLSRVQDRLQIFFAVLFWMSLFFWGSAWDGRNSSRKKKGPWFRK